MLSVLRCLFFNTGATLRNSLLLHIKFLKMSGASRDQVTTYKMSRVAGLKCHLQWKFSCLCVFFPFEHLGTILEISVITLARHP